MNPSMRTIYLLLTLLMAPLVVKGAEHDRTFRVLNAANDLADNSAQVIVCTHTGRMIISTIGNLNFYDGTSFSHIDTRQDLQYQLPLYRGNYHLYFDHSHHIWLKNTNTVTCVDLLTEQFIQNVDSVIAGMGCHEQVLDMFVDSLGCAWFLTEKGLYGVDHQKTYNVLRDRNLQEVEVMDNLLLLFYDDGEEVGMDIQTGNVVHRTKAYDWDTAQKYTNSSVLLRHKDGFYQIRNGSEGSILLHFDVPALQWTVVQAMDFHMNNLALKDNQLYIASEWGYFIYDIASGRMDHIKELALVGGNVMETDCNTLAFDRQGGMWIGTERRGLLYSRPVASPIKAYTWKDPQALKYAAMMDDIEQNLSEFQGQRANCLYTDSRGWSWIGTTTGLYLYKSPQSEPVLFNRRRGFYNNVVHSVVEDKSHNIWVATSCGISCILFNGETPYFVNSFGDIDNVPSESFVNCKAICLDDGTVVMQSIDHVVAFHPDSLADVNIPHTYKMYPKLIKLMVNGNVVVPNQSIDGNVVINKAITRVKDIWINSNMNSVVLHFSALNYYRPMQTYYRARVIGMDNDEWREYSYFDSDGKVDDQGRLHLPLMDLEPGDHEVSVQVSMFPGQWDGDPYVWIIHVNQPWWQTTGVFLIFAFIIVVLAIVNFVYYSRNTRMRLHRSHEEGDVVSKIRSFVDRCDTISTELLMPIQEDFHGGTPDSRTQLSPEFIEIMLKLMPYVEAHRHGDLSMRMMSEELNVEIVHLYEVISANIHKSPRELVRVFRLQRAAELLRTTDNTIEQISEECGFYTPNYFMGNFFHQYKQTPKEYRAMCSSNNGQ